MAKNERRGGEYRKMLLEQRGQAPVEEEPSGGAFFRIRLYVCICLFVAYVILDYTKASIGTVDSSRIYAEIERDMTDGAELREAWSNAVNSIWAPDSEEGSGPEEEVSEEGLPVT